MNDERIVTERILYGEQILQKLFRDCNRICRVFNMVREYVSDVLSAGSDGNYTGEPDLL